MRFALLSLTLMSVCASTFAATPEWVKNRETQVRRGDQLELVCTGTGPSLELARLSARESCQGSASDHLSTTLKVRTVSVETERDVALHQEISEDRKIVGLRCELLKESIEELENQVKVFQLCKFDLGKVTVAASETLKDPKSANTPELGSLASKTTAAPGRHLASSERRILLAVAPACDDLLIEGEIPRIIRCKGNPETVVLGQGDHKIVVRSKGFMPKTIAIPKEGVPDEDPIQVLLERAN